MNAITEYAEGALVTVKSGTAVGGLTLRTAQPGKIIRVQQSDEFGTQYIIALTDKPGQYVRIGADGIEAQSDVAALSPLDTMELAGAGDLVEWMSNGCAEPREGTVLEVSGDGQYRVEFRFCAQRWCYADDIRLLLKAAALEVGS